NAVRASHPNRIADVNLSLACPRFPLIQTTRFAAPDCTNFSNRLRVCIRRCFSTRSCSVACSPAMRDRFLRRPQRPGCPQRLHALGTAQQLTGTAHGLPFGSLELVTVRLLQNQPCTITGSAMFTS